MNMAEGTVVVGGFRIIEILRTRLSQCLNPVAHLTPTTAVTQICYETAEAETMGDQTKCGNQLPAPSPFPVYRELGAVEALKSYLNDVLIEGIMPPSLLVQGPPGSCKTKFIWAAIRSLSNTPSGHNQELEISNAILSVRQHRQELIVVHVSCNLLRRDNADAEGLRFVVKTLETALNQVVGKIKSMQSSIQHMQYLLKIAKQEGKVALIILDHFEILCKPVASFAPQQTLLYSLLDLQHRNLPVCTLAVSSVLNIFECLERRIRSRFSLRRIYIANPKEYKTIYNAIKLFLSISLEDFIGFDTEEGKDRLVASLDQEILKKHEQFVEGLMNNEEIQIIWKNAFITGREIGWFYCQAFEYVFNNIDLQIDSQSFQQGTNYEAVEPLNSTSRRSPVATKEITTPRGVRRSKRLSFNTRDTKWEESSITEESCGSTVGISAHFIGQASSNNITTTTKAPPHKKRGKFSIVADELSLKLKLFSELGRTEHLVLCALYRLHCRKRLPKNLHQIIIEINGYTRGFNKIPFKTHLAIRRAFYVLLSIGIVRLSKYSSKYLSGGDSTAASLEEFIPCKFVDYALYGKCMTQLKIETPLQNWALAELDFNN